MEEVKPLNNICFYSFVNLQDNPCADMCDLARETTHAN